MTFARAEPGPHYRSLRLVSETGIWELGLSAYSSGMRVRMGRRGRPPSVMDFCIGGNASLCMPVLSAVLSHLERLPETSVASEIDSVFPWAGTRPDMAVHLEALLGAEHAEL